MLVTLLLLIAGEPSQGSPTWTLYREPAIGSARLHVATFDANDTGGGTHRYNETNCAAAAELFYISAQLKSEETGLPPTKYWCEPGPYKAER